MNLYCWINLTFLHIFFLDSTDFGLLLPSFAVEMKQCISPKRRSKVVSLHSVVALKITL